MPLAGNGTDATSVARAPRAPARRRAGDLRATCPAPQAYVAGNLAFSEDFNAQLEHAIVPVIVFVLVLAFLLMLVAFRSVDDRRRLGAAQRALDGAPRSA